jgi:hypothetical protein
MKFNIIMQATDGYLDVRHFCFDCSSFLNNALRIWESMMLRIEKEKAKLQIYVQQFSRVPSK